MRDALLPPDLPPSSLQEDASVVVGWIAIHRVDMITRFVTLRRVLDDEMRTLNAVVSGDVASGCCSRRHRS